MHLDVLKADPFGQPSSHAMLHSNPNLVKLAIASIGVVYGDIGTSPIYALRETLAHVSDTSRTEANVIGVISLLWWALAITVTLKYVLFIMRADNRGEGGVLSLMALVQGCFGRQVLGVFLLGVVGAALFCGDAIITPAISVLSAIEGVKLLTPVFDPYVVPLTIAILVVLFASQRWGTHAVASLFGPIMLAWFGVLILLGLWHIGDAPQILTALNPLMASGFLMDNPGIAITILGSVFLAVTGAEALYADMGHLGRKPIQAAWLYFVFPALLINYAGQGAMVLKMPEMASEPFFLMAPTWALAPLVVLSGLATVIASQAVITGAFSLAHQAMQLGLVPRMEVRHTSATQEGEIYIPRINHLILFGVVLLVLNFKSSSALANAYGIAVSGTMVITTALAFLVTRYVWRWSLARSIAVSGFFIVIDLIFLAANLLKVLDGGYVPLLVGAAVVVIMVSFVRGTQALEQKVHRDSVPLVELAGMLERRPPSRVAGTAVFLTSDITVAPSALMHNLKHNKVLHETVLVVCVKTENVPRVESSARLEVVDLANGFTTVLIRFGYMERPNVPLALVPLRKAGRRFDIMKTSFFLGRRTLKPAKSFGLAAWQSTLFIMLTKRATPATDFFGIPTGRAVELGAQVAI